MKFKPIQDLDMPEGEPFLVLRHGNDAHKFLIQQVQIFEGQMYPDALAFAIDWSDRITDAVGWMEIAQIAEPETIDAT